MFRLVSADNLVATLPLTDTSLTHDQYNPYNEDLAIANPVLDQLGRKHRQLFYKHKGLDK